MGSCFETLVRYKPMNCQNSALLTMERLIQHPKHGIDLKLHEKSFNELINRNSYILKEEEIDCNNETAPESDH